MFKRIVNAADNGGEPFGVDDLYAAFLLQRAADGLDFGRGATKPARRQTRFLFYMVALDLLRDVMIRANLQAGSRNCTDAIIKLFLNGTDAAQAWLDCSLEVIDTYLTSGTEDSIFDEPAFRNTFNNDLNGFLKWERLGKSEQDSPRLRNSLAVNKSVMGRRLGTQTSPRDMIRAVITTNA